MKYRFDFVTNSSSTCYTVTLCIENTDGEILEFEGMIDETSDGYINTEGTCNPRIIANADSIEELKSLISSFSTLCDTNFIIEDASGKKIYYWSASDIPGCPEDDDEFDDWYFDLLRSEGVDGYVYQKLLASIDERIGTMDKVKRVSLACESKMNESTSVYEKYEYDLKTKALVTDYKAEDDGDDVTEEMLNQYYRIDCGDDCMYFQFKDLLKED